MRSSSRLLRWDVLTVASLCAAAASVAGAQCPDGAPPPCKAGRIVAATRRNALRLDDHTWIVVPFGNLARNPEIEWLRGASVNLLSLDLSRWDDIRVVDDKRVGDLLREIPASQGNTPLTLNDGLATARRAGAGNLVMGDLVQLGGQTRIVANVFNVKEGVRSRTVSVETASRDSLLSIFGRLARGLLNVAPPPGAKVGVVGTSRVDAYQEYLLGVQALNRFELGEARKRLERALQLDSSFALAHWKLAIVVGWESPTDSMSRIHAERAALLAGPLPARDRALIGALRSQKRFEYGRACDAYSALVRADSSDVDALYGFGECSFLDFAVRPLSADSTRFRFRGDWNAALRSYRRVLTLDPTYHLAFQRIVDILLRESRGGFQLPDGQPPPSGEFRPNISFSATVRRRGDSLVVEPVSFIGGRGALTAQIREAKSNGTWRYNLEQARGIAAEWTASAPGENRAHIALGEINLFLVRVEEADREFALIRGDLSRADSVRVHFDRLEVAVKRARGSEVRRLVDSWSAAHPGDLATGAVPAALIGRLNPIDSLLSANYGRALSSVAVRFYQQTMRQVLGVATDRDVVAATEAYNGWKKSSRAATPLDMSATFSEFGWSLFFGQQPVRSGWPFVAPLRGKRPIDPFGPAASHDMTALRAAASRLDSVAVSGDPDVGLFAGDEVVMADAYLTLGDSVSALRQLRHVLDTTLVAARMWDGFSTTRTSVTALLWPRAMLLRAELAAARGSRAEAREWYRRFVDLWASADPECQPLVARARAALVAMGGA